MNISLLSSSIAIVVSLTTAPGLQQAPVAAVHPAARSLTLIRSQTETIAERMPEDAYLLASSPTSRTFADLVGHIVDTNYGVCAGTQGLPNPRKGMKAEGAAADKATLVALLRASFDYCVPLFDAQVLPDKVGTDLLFVLTHTSEVKGIMAALAARHGVVIPNTETEKPAGRD